MDDGFTISGIVSREIDTSRFFILIPKKLTNFVLALYFYLPYIFQPLFSRLTLSHVKSLLHIV